MILTKDLTKIYSNGVVALEQLSLSVEKGEFVFLVGPSGAGKTTFLNLIIRRELPTAGLLSVNQKNIASLKKDEIAFLRRSIGVIFQDYKLLPHKTVYENISFALEVIETGIKEIKQRVYSVLELVGLLISQMSSLLNYPAGNNNESVSPGLLLIALCFY